MQVRCFLMEHRGDGFIVSERLFRTLSNLKPKHAAQHTYDPVLDSLLCVVFEPKLAVENEWVGKGWNEDEIHHAAILVIQEVYHLTQDQISELAPEARKRVLGKQAA